MSQVTNQGKQGREAPESISPGTPISIRRSLAPLGQATAVALLGNALAITAYLIIVLIVFQTFVSEFFVGIIPALIVAGLVIGRVRWAPALGAAVVVITSTLLLTTPEIQYHLAHPGTDASSFIPEIIILAFALVVLVTGIAATFQNYRYSEQERAAQRAPHWLGKGLSALSGIVIGMIIVSLIVAANPSASTSVSTSTSGEPSVHMTASTFVQNVVLVPKGSKLLLVNDDSTEHILTNGTWTASGSVNTTAEPGAPLLHNIDSKSGSIEIGPFNTAGVFHIYCTIHKGMNLTIVVQ